MSESLNSKNNSTTSTEAVKEAVAEIAEKITEEIADLTLNHDEVLDVELALGALGGLRHSAACNAAERSTRRFDERQHRLHESRMKALGMEGEEPEAEDMSQQVLIRSPITHYHYPPPSGASPQPTQPAQPQPSPQQPPSPPVSPSPPAANGNGRLSPLKTAALVLGSVGLGSALTGGTAYYLSQPQTTINAGEKTGIKNVSPGPPHQKKAENK